MTFHAFKMSLQRMYLLDTNVISEMRKGARANHGVQNFFAQVSETEDRLYISVITIGELRRGVELVRHRGDVLQADRLDQWLLIIVDNYSEHVLDFSESEAQVWGQLRVPHPENAIDKQIAAIALTYDLTIVTRNVNDFRNSGVRLLNPFD